MASLGRLNCVWLCFVLGACGGGGGGGASPSPGGNNTNTRGQFTLAQNSASFERVYNDSNPATQRVAMTITGTDVVYAGAAYSDGQVKPQWLNVEMTGAGRNYDLVVTIFSFALTPGTHSTTFRVGTADASGNILASTPFTVTVDISPRLWLAGTDANYTFVYGDGTLQQDLAIPVQAEGKQWRATSSASWLQVPTDTFTGNHTLVASVDVEALAPGTYEGTISVANDALAADVATRLVAVTIHEPSMTVNQDALVFSRGDGTPVLAQDLSIVLNAGGATHPYSIAITTDSGGNWLRSTASAGSVDTNGVTVGVSAVPSNLPGATYTGELVVTVPVRNIILSQSIPVTFNLEANRIVVGTAGVMLSASPAPGRSVLSREVPIYSSIDLNDVPWTATDDQAWLTVTSSGTTGGSIELTADTTGLAQNTVHFATVRVASSDPTVENEQSIRVGLYVNGVAPANVSNVDETLYLVASPVEPLAFTNFGGSDIVAYNVFTGDIARTFNGVVANAGVMVMSQDGRRLFVYDTTNLRVTELDATTGNVVRNYPSGTRQSTTPYGGGLAFFRPDGYDTLVTPSARIYDLESGDELNAQDFFSPLSAMSLVPSHDQRYLVTDSGSAYRIKRSVLNGGEVRATHTVSTGTAGGRAGQACFSADGGTIYTASGYPYNFPGSDAQTGATTRVLPGEPYPNSVVCLWNGLIIGGIDGYYETYDVWIYDGPTGQQLANVSSSAGTGAYRSLRDRGIAVSGDGTRMITLTGHGPYNDIPAMRLQSIPGPL